MAKQVSMDNVKILVAPPEYYPGNAGTFLLQGPNKDEVHEKMKVLEKACFEMGMKDFEVVDDRPDPNGGWKMLILTHNFNPVTWASEKMHRVQYGTQAGWEVGRKKAAIKHRVGVKAEIGRAALEEANVQKRKDINLIAQSAAIRGAGQEKIYGAGDLAAAREKAAYDAAIAAAKVQPQSGYASLSRDIYG